MNVKKANQDDGKIWNEFVRKNYPPVGNFMQSWEWGLFQEKMGRKVERYFILNGGTPVAAFTLIYHSMPFDLKYGYAARGPVVTTTSKKVLTEIFETIRAWALENAPQLVFLRLEPPIDNFPSSLSRLNYHVPRYYIQPRYNLFVPLSGTEEEILLSFHSSTRSNVRRAEKRGVTVTVRPDISEPEYGEFKNMMKDTTKRNSGVNTYPGYNYFDSLFAVLSQDKESGDDSHKLSLEFFLGYHDGELAAIHAVLFFGKTATYLYGASYARHLNSKISTYLHFSAMTEAKRRGMLYYDIGGIDEKRWPTLTEFKRQFHGKETAYIGNINLPIRPFIYWIYNFLRNLKK
jgi:lipid II:glycine glycyltransferase (peptidoglycan interpeptide bridge formation enzyme)